MPKNQTQLRLQIYYQLRWGITNLCTYKKHFVNNFKSQIAYVATVLLIASFTISCSNEVKCHPQDIEFIKKNIDDEIINLTEVSLKDYSKKIDENWNNITWKNKLGIGESESEISDRIWRSTGFYENFEQIIESNLDDAEVVFNSEVDLSFKFNDSTAGLVEDINDKIYGIYEVKDPDYYTFYTMIVEEWVIFLIAFIIALIIGGSTGGFYGALYLAGFIEIILLIVYWIFFMPDETQFMQQKITNSFLEAETEIKSISTEITDMKLFKICE